jgi:hypothetical protein
MAPRLRDTVRRPRTRTSADAVLAGAFLLLASLLVALFELLLEALL